ncbi:MAG: tRNA pseudouridine(38-40) synthase TruA [Steroidobacteraceae bacterium]
MPRIALGLEYDGRGYAGWQAQAGGLATVQGIAEAALSRVADEPVSLTCAGRTDAGVHAMGQVAHFDTGAQRTMRAWALGANTNLPSDVSVHWACEVPERFHARHSAESRTYCYLILNRGTRSALAHGRATLIHHRLDEGRMAQAAAHLLGEHDFSAFRAAQCQSRTPIRRLEELLIERRGEWILVRATANAFLHHMVRNIAGLLIAVGRDRAEPAWAREVLASRDRSSSAPTAPPDGLYLWRVRYSHALALPESAGGSAWDIIPGLQRPGSTSGR